jgi:nucleotide-binding universal stress UspA family protein
MTNKLRQILVPVDFTLQSRVALDHSKKLAKHIGAEITLLNIVEPVKKGNSTSLEKTSALIEGKLREFAKESLLSDKVRTIVCSGGVSSKIVENAKTINANFIVMGAFKSKDKLDSTHKSNYALKVIKDSSTPVITISGKLNRDSFENIILPLDLSNVTTQKVSKTIELARLGSHTIIKLLSVVFTSDDFTINRLTNQMQQVKTTIRDAGVQCTAEIIKANKDEESIGDVILDYTRRVEGDLIVIMTHQDKANKKIIDKDAEEIITSSEIPVLSILPNK